METGSLHWAGIQEMETSNTILPGRDSSHHCVQLGLSQGLPWGGGGQGLFQEGWGKTGLKDKTRWRLRHACGGLWAPLCWVSAWRQLLQDSCKTHAMWLIVILTLNPSLSSCRVLGAGFSLPSTSFPRPNHPIKLMFPFDRGAN